VFDFMEHRMGVEPMNTGFAGEKICLFSATYGDFSVLKSPVKSAWEFSRWWQNGGNLFSE
jgi:hypothetical protein